jgi:hypothetical protein
MNVPGGPGGQTTVALPKKPVLVIDGSVDVVWSNGTRLNLTAETNSTGQGATAVNRFADQAGNGTNSLANGGNSNSSNAGGSQGCGNRGCGSQGCGNQGCGGQGCNCQGGGNQCNSQACCNQCPCCRGCGCN